MLTRELVQASNFAPLPESARTTIPAPLANELLRAAESLPLFENKDFYSPALQTLVRDHVHEASPEAVQWLVGSIRQRLSQWPYCVLVEGLDFDSGNRLFVAINRAFGELVALPYQKPRAQLVHYIEPSTDIASSRGGTESETLHTDTADWETPVELISMVCIRADQAGGGRSLVLDVDAVREEVKTHLGTESLNLLQTEPVPWRLAAYRGGGVTWRTVLSESGMCWRRYTVNLALACDGVTVTGKMQSLLDAFESVITSSTRTMDFLMREGELLFLDNRRTLHARTPVIGKGDPGRLMIRSWIRVS